MEQQHAAATHGYVILQTVSQAYVHRLAIYASAPSLAAFPLENGRLCDEVQELGKDESKYNGPCLLLLRNCRLAPQQLLQHIRSTFLRGYIMRIYWCKHSASSKSQMLFHLGSLIEAVKGENACSTSNGEEEGGLERIHLDCSVEHTPEVAPRFRIQTYPRDLANVLFQNFAEMDFGLHDYTHSIYVVEIDGTFYYGLDVASTMYILGSNREALSKGFLSKASTKIEEALQVTKFRLHSSMSVLDIGAAPGAWTEYISPSVRTVLAVDPGKLCEKAKAFNVYHICKKVEDAEPELKCWTTERCFDLLVCDINKHPIEAAKIVLPLLQYLISGGGLILTLKFHGRGISKPSKVSEIFDLFHGMLRSMDCIWLMANSIYERTFIGTKI